MDGLGEPPKVGRAKEVTRHTHFNTISSKPFDHGDLGLRLRVKENKGYALTHESHSLLQFWNVVSSS